MPPPTRRSTALRRRAGVLVICCATTLGCGDDPTAAVGESGGPPGTPETPQCIALPLQIHSTAVRKDGIPALSNPAFLHQDEPNAGYVRDDMRVVGITVADQPLALPLNILWWHEVVNISRGGEHVAVSYCPLTGSSLAFDRLPIGGNELRVSGLLYDNNLIMFNRAGDESLWAQMLGQAICGPAKGATLPIVPSIETSFAEWERMHPNTLVVTIDTGFDRDYTLNPYEDYWRLDAPPLFEEQRSDTRREPKELTLGIPEGESGGGAIPFGTLDSEARDALTVPLGESELVVFWDGPSQTASAFFGFAEWPSGFDGPGGILTFDATETGYVDEQTGTVWNLEGVAVAGPGAGATLLRHPRAFVAFWFAWTVLRPEMEIFDPES